MENSFFFFLFSFFIFTSIDYERDSDWIKAEISDVNNQKNHTKSSSKLVHPTLLLTGE